MNSIKCTLVVTALSFGLATSASASIFTLNYSGEFGPTSGFDTGSGVVPFGANTPFSYSAVFDTAVNLFPMSGLGLFSISSLNINVAGYGVYSSDPTAGLAVIIADPVYLPGMYGIGIADSVLNDAYGFFGTASPAFSVASLSSTVFSDFIGADMDKASFTIPLSGGNGNLVFNDYGVIEGLQAPHSASITGSSVPEPGQWAMMGMMGLGFAGMMGRRYFARKEAKV